MQEDGPELRGDLEDVDSDYAYHQCGRRELQVFQSDSYAGIYRQNAQHTMNNLIACCSVLSFTM